MPPEEAAINEAQRHRLAAIMFTDIVGYSALAAKNELEALEAIGVYERISRPIFSEHSGLEIKKLGDGSLVEFDSALAATRCAIELQRAMHEHNLQAPDAEKVKLRIGIHVGEIIHREGDVFGDGVNVASRVQPLAPPEGVCFTEDVWRLVKDKVPVQVVKLGASEMKNLGRAISVYRIRFPWDSTSVTGDRANIALGRKSTRWLGFAALAGAAIALAVLYGRPLGNASTGVTQPTSATAKESSLVVMPFKNLSDDKKLDYWGDGLTEELIGALSTSPNLGVMGRETAWSYKGKTQDIRDVCKSLNVLAALEGTVRKEGDRIRISVRMTDGKTGLAMWTEKYDEKTEDVFKVQERIANAVASRLQGSSGTVAESRGSTNPLAYDSYLQGRALLRHFEQDRASEAQALFEKAIKLQPNFAKAYASLAEAFYMQSNVKIPPNEAMPKMRAAAMKSVELDPKLADGYVMLGLVRFAYDWEWTAAGVAYEEAIRLSPSTALGYQYLGTFEADMGRFEKALEHLKFAIRLDPASPQMKRDYVTALYKARRFDDAMRYANENLDPSDTSATMVIADCELEGQRPDLAEQKYVERFKVTQSHVPLSHLVMAQAAQGKRKEALASLQKLKRREVRGGFVTAYFAGIALAAAGEIDEAFREWERAFEDRSENMVTLAVDPHVDKYRSDPRFKRLLQLMNLPDLPVPPRQKVTVAAN
jgi:adenylate cyclase